MLFVPASMPTTEAQNSNYKKYTDDDNRFTIEYPDNWVLSDSHPDEIIAIQDKYELENRIFRCFGMMMTH